MPPPPSGNVYPFAAPPRSSLRRTMLWELAPPLHCAVIGTCLGIDELRRLLDQLFAGSSDCDDYALHAGTVRECATRNKVSEMLQAALDRRHEAALQQLDDATDDADFELAWTEAARRLDVAGVFWALVTHPRCGNALREQLFRDVHMLQHLSLAELARQRQAARPWHDDNERLRRELADKAAECDALRAAASNLPSAASPASLRPAGPGFLARLRRLVPPRRLGHEA